MKPGTRNVLTLALLFVVLVAWNYFDRDDNGNSSPRASATPAITHAPTLPSPGFTPNQPGGKTFTGTVQHITDGDTVRVRINGKSERVRLIGVDAPEVHTSQDCGGNESWNHLQSILRPGDNVTVITDPSQAERDVYDRILGYIDTSAGLDVGYEQIRAGWADVFRLARNSERYLDYLDAVSTAKQQRLGVWGRC